MLEKFSYVNHRGQKLDFGSGGELFANYSDLHDHSWSYTKTGTRVSSFDRATTKKTINGFIKAPTAQRGIQLRNQLCDIAEADIIDQQAGRLVVGDWYLNCYIVGISYGDYLIDKSYLKIKITVLIEDPMWIRESEFNFGAGFGEMVGGFDYPFDFPIDFGALPIDSLDNDNLNPCEFIMRIYGSASNPSISVGGHVYQVNTSVGAGEYIEINSKSKTIVKHTSAGTEQNVFGSRKKDSYIFQKIASGNNAVSWAGSYDVAITLLAERSEPQWT